MNWLTNRVLPKFNVFGRKKDSPENLWDKCPACGQMVFHGELEQAARVCTHCDFHMRIGPEKRFEILFDDAKYQTIELPEVVADPLKFRDAKRYTEVLKDYRGKTGARDAVAVAVGTMAGSNIVIAAQNFAFMGGSVGRAAGEAIVVAADRALADDAALIAISASGGMRMQEGILSLMQMPRTTIAVQRLKEAGLPFIVVLTDPTTGGVTASFAMLGDVTIAEPGALIGFAGPRVIEQTIREQLPDGFQRAEFLLDHGMLDMVVHRHRLRDTLIRVVDLLRNPRQEPAPSGSDAASQSDLNSDLKSALEIPDPGTPIGEGKDDGGNDGRAARPSDQD